MCGCNVAAEHDAHCNERECPTASCTQSALPTIRSMPIHCSKQGLIFSNVLFKGKAVVLVDLLVARLTTSTAHACHLHMHEWLLHKQHIEAAGHNSSNLVFHIFWNVSHGGSSIHHPQQLVPTLHLGIHRFHAPHLQAAHRCTNATDVLDAPTMTAPCITLPNCAGMPEQVFPGTHQRCSCKTLFEDL